MIVVKVEMWPRGDESRAVEFARMEIVNREATTVQTAGQLGDYDVVLRGGVYGNAALYHRVWKRCSVTGFNRRARGVWDLLFLALRNAVGDRNWADCPED